MSAALSRAGYEVICALDGDEALRYARKERADLILLDLLLPKMPGIEVLARLKKDHETSDIPVVVSSGLSEKNREQRLAAGADDYLEKSMLMPDKGINLLPNDLDRRGLPDQPQARGRLPPSPDVTRPTGANLAAYEWVWEPTTSPTPSQNILASRALPD
jgi:CheY-like chemotaxis protein